jgi:hypothetical protein
VGDAGFGSKVELYGVKISTVKNYSTNSYASEQFLKKRGKFNFSNFRSPQRTASTRQASMSGRVRKGGFVVFQVFIHHSLLISRSSWRAPPPEPRK